MSDERYEIAYKEAVRSIADQQTALDILQGRAATVASAGAIATGLIGIAPGSRDGLGLFGVAAVLLLLAIVALSGIVIWPRREWKFHFQPSKLHWNYIEGPEPVSADLMRRDLALYLDTYFQVNASKIDRFGALVSLAITLLFFDVVAVLLSVWRG